MGSTSCWDSALANVKVWQTQLMRNDFPPVCAMTGAPAEMWRKFTFTNTPAWAFMFGAIGAAAFSRRVSGYLPLTKRSSQRITRVRWLFAGFIPLAVLLWIAAAIAAPADQTDSTRNTIAGVLLLLGVVALLVALVGLVVARSSFGPTARIMERRGQPEPLIELRRVHPAFVAAVQQHQQARAAHFASAQPPTPPPPPPESPFPPGKFSY